MQHHAPERYVHTYNRPAAAPPFRVDRQRSSSTCERASPPPRISVIQDEVDMSNYDSCSDIEDDLESSDYMSEDESSTAPSVERPPTPQTDYSDAYSSRYSTPASPYQRRISIAGNSASINASQRIDEVSRRFSAPDIETKCLPPDRTSVIRQTPPSKPQNPPLKLYPWMTRKESSPPVMETKIRCPYPTNDCTDALPKNLVVWRRHLANKHGLVKDAAMQICQWPGCERAMGGRSLNRHVLITHMDFKTNCPYCNERRRPDHMEKHIAKCLENPARNG